MRLGILVGGNFGDGSWGNSQVVPLLPQEGQEYDKKTGKGVISWTGYLSTAGFKLKKNPASWDDGQVGQGASFGDFKYNDGGSSDIKVPTAGYYTITFDTKNPKLKIVPLHWMQHLLSILTMALQASTMDGLLLVEHQ